MTRENEHPMHVALGSINPVKVAAVHVVIRKLYNREIGVTPVAARSGVSAQPWGDIETRQGAINRARRALSEAHADLGLGLEGGVLQVGSSFFTSAWCAVVDRDGLLSTAGGANMPLPPPLVEALKSGEEMGPAMDRLSGQEDTGRRIGTIGVLTQEYITRQSAFEQVLIYAFAPLLNPELYSPIYPHTKEDTTP